MKEAFLFPKKLLGTLPFIPSEVWDSSAHQGKASGSGESLLAYKGHSLFVPGRGIGRQEKTGLGPLPTDSVAGVFDEDSLIQKELPYPVGLWEVLLPAEAVSLFHQPLLFFR